MEGTAGSCGRSIQRGESMIRQNKVPLAVLAALLIAWVVVPSEWGAPDPMAPEQDTERIG